RGQRRPGSRLHPVAQGAADPVRARPRRRAHPAVPGRRRRGRRGGRRRRNATGVKNVDEKLYLPAGTAGDGPFSLVVTPERAGWGYSGLRVLDLAPGQAHSWATGGAESLVLPLSGSAVVTCAGPRFDSTTFALQGRRDVFSRVSDFCYVPRDATVTVTSAGGGTFAVPSALCANKLPPRYGPAEEVPVELRGAGQASRQVNNFCAPEAFECDKLIAVEVLTPGGNWSSYPPHK